MIEELEKNGEIFVQLDDIQPSKENSNIYHSRSKTDINELADSIDTLGLIEPLLITLDNVIISGHSRYKALRLLNRHYAPVRYKNVYSHDSEFINYLVAANKQRVKSDHERFNETEIEVDPVEYIRRREELLNKSIDLDPVIGELKANRKLSDNYKDLHEAIVKVIRDNRSFLPMPLRGIHYQLLNDPPIESVRTGKKYSNSISSYKMLSREATKLRVADVISYTAIRDDKRKFNINRGFQDKHSFVRQELDDFLAGYHRDLLQTQDRFFCLVCEKETVSSPVDRIARKYCMPVLYSQGNSSITVRNSIIEESKYKGGKPITLLFLSDLDPSGYNIQDSMVGSFEKDFKADLIAYRIGITKNHIKEYNLKSDQSIKKTDTKYKKFVKNTGLDKAYEIEALPPESLMEIIEIAIKSSIDLDRFNHQQEMFNEDVSFLEIKRNRFFEVMKWDDF